jgi:pimeloyl-ACP methyl ester carboxylesterase
MNPPSSKDLAGLTDGAATSRSPWSAPTTLRRQPINGIVASGALFAAGLLFASNLPAAVEDTAKKPAPTAEELTTWLSPYRTEQATLAPDGRHLAYAVHENERTMIAIIDVDEPSKKVVVPVDHDAIIRDSHDHERTPIRLPFLRWVGSNRLVFQAQLPALEEVDIRRQREPRDISVVYAVDADGRNLVKLLDEDSLTLLSQDGSPLPRQPRVVDVAANVPDSILVEATRPTEGGGTLLTPERLGRVSTTLFRVNVRTGQRQILHDQDVNGSLLYDHQGQARIQFIRPVDQAEQSFLSLPTPGRKASRQLEQLFGDTITPANLLGTRTFPVAFDYDPDILYVASNAGRDTYGLYTVDLRTGQRTAVAVENPAFDLVKFGFDAPGVSSALVFDPGQKRLVGVRVDGIEGVTTQWIDPELTGLQARLEQELPGRSVEVINWDDARTHFLLFVSSTGDPGRYYVYRHADDHLTQIVRRAPGVDPDKTNAARSFAFTTPEGVRLTGYLTVPRQPFRPLPPLMVFLHGGPWERDEPGFNRDAQAFAAMGFVVLQVNYRGSAGFGTRVREGLRETIDEAPLADIRAALAWVGTNATYDHKRVALLGQGFGGYLALRALQRYPDDFRCAVAINAPTDLELWVQKPASWKENVVREGVLANNMTAIANFLQGFGGGAHGSLGSAAPSGPKVPSFAKDGMGAIDDFPAPIGAPNAPAPLTPPSGGSGGGGGGGGAGGPPLPPPEYVNFASEFRQWYFGTNAKRLAALSPAQHADEITKPVLLIQDPEDEGGETGVAGAMRSALTRAGNPPDYLEITGEFTRGLPRARLQVLTAIQEFFVVNIYEFGVKIGPLKVRK